MTLIALAFGGPFVLWALLYALAQYGHVNLKPIVTHVRVLRQITATIALLSFVIVFTQPDRRHRAPFMFLAFSSGIGLVCAWIRQRFTPEELRPREGGSSPGRTD